ncbi:MtrAB system histidine kinase MtrB [Buchananella felis]|uniref:MtrAB system histidine kinase MtrB n=1 Tax=Buchananella felis TaxID=3231492 RepID=UPI0035274E93
MRMGRRWRTHLGERIAWILTGAGTALAMVIFLLLANAVRTNTYEARVENLLSDAAVRTAAAQVRLDAAGFTTVDQVQNSVSELVASLYESAQGAGAVGVVLQRAARETAPVRINDLQTSASLSELISPQLRESLGEGASSQFWQPVALPGEEGTEPGVVVASSLTLPLVGVMELYIFYTVEPEQRVISQIVVVMMIASVALVFVLGLLTYLIVSRQLRPVRETSAAAARLAAGHLTERVEVSGEDEVAVLGRSFNEMAASLQEQIDRLGELSRLQQRFVSDVSHELRTPLTTITAAAQMLHDARDEIDPIHRRPIELLAEQTTRFAEMLSDLLEVSRFDAGAAVLSLEDRDLREVVRRTVDLVAPIASDRGCELILDEPAERCGVQIDPRRIERVLRNLLVNAIEHGDGRPIQVKVAAADGTAAVRVRDYGAGMTQEVAEHVFDRFYRADPSRARTLGGTGLGLAISLEDAHLHGGSLEAWGREGEGASFLLALPTEAGQPLGPSPIALEPEDRVAYTPAVGLPILAELDPTELTEQVDDVPARPSLWRRLSALWRGEDGRRGRSGQDEEQA